MENYKFKIPAKNGKEVEYQIFDTDEGLGLIFYKATKNKKNEGHQMSAATFFTNVKNGKISLVV